MGKEIVEFRLYYDDNGDVICYTSEKLPGNFIMIDVQTHAEARTDIKVFDGKIIRSLEGTVVTKLIPAIVGVRCAIEDVNIIVDNSYPGHVTSWNTRKYEFRYN
jgi:hypothetical protein